MLQEHTFGYWLRLKRKALDLTREALADRVGCSAAAIRKIEAEERRPSAQMANRLAEIFNIPPDERLAFVQFARRLAPSPVPHQPAEAVPWNTSRTAPRSNLPASATSLIGREQEISRLQEYLADDRLRLVTLTGPPGIGKTRLSLEVGRIVVARFPNGVFFVPLALLDDPALLASTVLQAMGYQESKNLPAPQQLRDSLWDKNMLLILDNCEHLIAEVAWLVSELLTSCPYLKILVTSREALRIPGEWLLPVPSLSAPTANAPLDVESAARFPALRLFAERARAVRMDFTLNPDNLPLVASICARLDGLPLAIELIAAQTRLTSPQALLEQMSDQYILSADGMRLLNPRHKTLRNAIAWSYDSLPAEEQTLFAWLSVFSGGFSLSAVEGVFPGNLSPRSTSNLLINLLDKSLIQRIGDEAGEDRFTMLATIKQFAGEILRLNGNEAAARDRHLAHFLAFAERAEAEMRAAHQAEWTDRLEQEHDNLHAALEWSVASQQTAAALRLLCALGWPWEVRGRYSEARLWLERIRALPQVQNYPLIYARLLNHIGRHSWTQENAPLARSLLEESQSISLHLGEQGELNLAETLCWLGLSLLRSPEEARDIFMRSLTLFQKWEDGHGVALSTFHLGIAESELGNLDAALAYLEDSLARFTQYEDRFFMARVSLFLGFLFMKMGLNERARHFFEQQLQLDEGIKFWDGIAEGWRNLGILSMVQQEYSRAGAYFEASVAVCQEHGLIKFDSFYLAGLAALKQTNYPLAYQRLSYQLIQTSKSAEHSGLGALFYALSAIASATDQADCAAQLLGAAQAILERSQEKLDPSHQAEFDRCIQLARNQLGEALFLDLQTRGRGLTLDRALACALHRE